MMTKPKVLVIDDEPPIRDIIGLGLRSAGLELIYAENGKDGIDKFKEHSPEVVLLDLKMPIMTGLEFLEALEPKLEDPFTIVVLSGHGTEDEVGRCFEMGISAYIRKPFAIPELIGAVNTALTLNRFARLLGFMEKISLAGLGEAADELKGGDSTKALAAVEKVNGILHDAGYDPRAFDEIKFPDAAAAILRAIPQDDDGSATSDGTS